MNENCYMYRHFADKFLSSAQLARSKFKLASTEGHIPNMKIYWMVAISFLMIGCAPKLIHPSIDYKVISNDICKYKKIAVIPFIDAPGAPYTGHTAQGIAIQALNRVGFSVVERGRLAVVLNEQKFSQSGLISDDQSFKVGKLIGASAVVFGEVGQYETHQRKTDTVYFPVISKKSTSYVPVQGKQWTENYASVTLRVVDIETGQLIFSGSGSYAQGVKEAPPQLVKKLINAIFKKWWESPGIPGYEINSAKEIIRVHKNSSAEILGLKVGDKVVKYTPNYKSKCELPNIGFPGDIVKVSILRNGTIIDFQVKLIDRNQIEPESTE